MTRYEFCEKADSHGLAVVALNGKLGLYDCIKQEEVVPPKYDAIKVLHPDCFAVRTGDSWGAIDRSLKTIAHCIFDEICRFDDTHILLFPSETTGLIGLMSKDGIHCSRMDYERFRVLKNGYFAVKRGDFWGVINENLVECVPTDYIYIEHCTNNLFLAEMRKYMKDYLVVINDKNEIIKTLPDYRIKNVCDNYFILCQGTKCYILDTNLEKVFDTAWNNVSIFNNDIAVASVANTSYILDLKSKNEIFSSSYVIKSICDGLFALYSKDQVVALYSLSLGLINLPANPTIETFRPMGSFIIGCTSKYTCKYTWGLFDCEGKVLIEPKYSDIFLLEDFIIVSLYDKYGIYDKNYHLVSKIIYDKVYEICKNPDGNGYMARVRYNGKDGIFYF